MKWHALGVLAIAGMARADTGPAVREITGQVIDAASRQPVIAARVALIRFATGRPVANDVFAKFGSFGEADGVVQTSYTGEDGRFRFPVKVGEQYSLHVRHEDYSSTGDGSAEPRMFTVKAGVLIPPVVFALVVPVAISGKVIDHDTERPIPGLSVFAASYQVLDGSRFLRPNLKWGRTDQEGRYEIRGLKPGEYTLGTRPATR